MNGDIIFQKSLPIFWKLYPITQGMRNITIEKQSCNEEQAVAHWVWATQLFVIALLSSVIFLISKSLFRVESIVMKAVELSIILNACTNPRLFEVKQSHSVKVGWNLHVVNTDNEPLI